MTDSKDYWDLPDVRDGLKHKERIVLMCLNQAQRERGGRNVPTVMLYGRVIEYVDMSVEEFQSILQRFVGVHGDGSRRASIPDTDTYGNGIQSDGSQDDDSH